MTASVVVDADVFSYLYKGDTRAAAYARHLVGTDPHLAFATAAELYRWAFHRGWSQGRVDRLRAAIAKYTTLHSDDTTALEWARVMSIKGQPASEGDAWVAAVALRHDMPLVTHNRKHFEHPGPDGHLGKLNASDVERTRAVSTPLRTPTTVIRARERAGPCRSDRAGTARLRRPCRGDHRERAKSPRS